MSTSFDNFPAAPMSRPYLLEMTTTALQRARVQSLRLVPLQLGMGQTVAANANREIAAEIAVLLSARKTLTSR